MLDVEFWALVGIEVRVVAENDSLPADDDPTSPPSIEKPRILAVGYWEYDEPPGLDEVEAERQSVSNALAAARRAGMDGRVVALTEALSGFHKIIHK
jgi:hypothetical protein